MVTQFKKSTAKEEELMEELFEVEDFLILYTKNLLTSISPEAALLLSIKQYKGDLHNVFNLFVKRILHLSYTFNDAVVETAQQFINPQSTQIFTFIMQFLEEDPKGCAERALRLLYRLKENKQLYFKRRNIIKGQEFKIKFLVFMMAIVLGLITALSPWFSVLSILDTSGAPFNLTGFSFSATPSVYVLITFLLVCLVNSATLYQIVKVNNKLLYILLTLIIFLLIYFMSSTFITSILAPS
ncbi:MAG: hypothetical protein ACTSQY_04245 [Candidatus Odinarchaeia archaeon]